MLQRGEAVQCCAVSDASPVVPEKAAVTRTELCVSSSDAWAVGAAADGLDAYGLIHVFVKSWRGFKC